MVGTAARRFALVTGAAGGIGRAMVSVFAANGYRVIALDNRETSQRLKEVHYIQADLRRSVLDGEYLGELVSGVKQLVGDDGLHVLVNNAAVQLLGGAESLNVEDWRSTVDVNLIAPFLWTQALLPCIESARGSVINMSSIHARLTKPNFVAYATSKAALSGMTRALAVDIGSRVRVNAIEPAAIDTDMLRAGFHQDTGRFSELKLCHPTHSLGTPDEVARLALAIADGSLAFLNGSCIGIDGGISAQLHDPT